MQPKFKRKRQDVSNNEEPPEQNIEVNKKIDFRVTVGEGGTVIKNIFQEEEDYFIEETRETTKQPEEPQEHDTTELTQPTQPQPEAKKSPAKKKPKLKRLISESAQQPEDRNTKAPDMYFEEEQQSPQKEQKAEEQPAPQKISSGIQYIDSEDQKGPHFTQLGHQQPQNEQVTGNTTEQKPKIISITTAHIQNRKKFLTSTIPKGYILQCTVKRNKSGLNMFYPQYDVYLSDQCRYLMSGKKKSGNVNNTYIISSSINDFDSDNPQYLGRVKSNSTGTNYIIYDDGYKPGNMRPTRSERNVITNISYESTIFGIKGPRRIKCYLPNPENPPSLYGQVDYISAYEKDKSQVALLCNKPPKWNQKLQIHVLNFRGRVDKPSVKNFILVRDLGENVEQQDVMLFGRMSQDIFNMDVEYPLSPVQALGIMLSSFDFKFGCQ